MHYLNRSILNRGIWYVALLSAALAACGPGEQAKQEPAQVETSAAPTAADFNPCNTTTFSQVQTVIGVPTTISSRDNTGASSPDWAICSFGRADQSPGPTYTVRVARFENSTLARRRHQDIIGGLPNAESIIGDPNNATVWVDGNNLHLQYQSGWWIVRRTVEGQTDAPARDRLLAVPRWPVES
jgi:hypothetical protein